MNNPLSKTGWIKLKAIKENALDSIVIATGDRNTGKTKTIAERIINLVKHMEFDPSKIYMLAITNKDVTRMKEILLKSLDENIVNQLNIVTFHTFCCGLLRKFGSILDIQTNFNVASMEDTRFCIEKIIKSLILENSQVDDDYVEQILLKVIDLQANKKSPEIYFKEFIVSENDPNVRKKNLLLHNVYSEYICLKSQSNSLDFSDLLMQCHKLFSLKHPLELSDSVLLVDDLHELTNLQYEILTDFASMTKNITVCANPYQDSTLLRKFVKNFKDFRWYNLDGYEKRDLHAYLMKGSALVFQKSFEPFKAGDIIWEYKELNKQEDEPDEIELYTTISKLNISGFASAQDLFPIECIPLEEFTSRDQNYIDVGVISVPTLFSTKSKTNALKYKVSLKFNSERQRNEWLSACRVVKESIPNIFLPDVFHTNTFNAGKVSEESKIFKITRPEIINSMESSFAEKIENIFVEFENIINQELLNIEQRLQKQGNNIISTSSIRNIINSFNKPICDELINNNEITEWNNLWQRAIKADLENKEKYINGLTIESHKKEIEQPFEGETIVDNEADESSDAEDDEIVVEIEEEQQPQMDDIEIDPKDNEDEIVQQFNFGLINSESKNQYELSSPEDTAAILKRMREKYGILNQLLNTPSPLHKEIVEDSNENTNSGFIDNAENLNKKEEEIHINLEDEKEEIKVNVEDSNFAPTPKEVNPGDISELYNSCKEFQEKYTGYFHKSKLSTVNEEDMEEESANERKVLDKDELDIEVERLLNESKEHLRMNDLDYSFDAEASSDITNISFLSNTVSSPTIRINLTEITKEKVTSPFNNSKLFSGIASKIQNEKYNSPNRNSPSLLKASFNRSDLFSSTLDAPSRKETSPTKSISPKVHSPPKTTGVSPTTFQHVQKMLKSGITLYKHSSSGNSKKKLRHVFLSNDGKYICYTKPDLKKVSHLLDIKEKYPISSIKGIQRSEEVKARRQSEIKTSITSTLFGIKKDELKI
ncbi:hypothetical protein ABK040_012671 [Willaertia magna]